MASRANRKGFLRLSLVTCPVALFPATSDSEKNSFQSNRKTGHRIKYLKVDAESGDEVAADDIINLMDALKRSLSGTGSAEPAPAKARTPKKRPGRRTATRPGRAGSRSRKVRLGGQQAHGVR